MSDPNLETCISIQVETRWPRLMSKSNSSAGWTSILHKVVIIMNPTIFFTCQFSIIFGRRICYAGFSNSDGGGKVWGKDGTEGWDQVRGGRGQGEHRRQRERCAAHSCCPLITPLSLTTQQQVADPISLSPDS